MKELLKKLDELNSRYLNAHYGSHSHGVTAAKRIAMDERERIERVKSVVFEKLYLLTLPGAESNVEHTIEKTLLQQILIEANLIDEFNDWLKEQ